MLTFANKNRGKLTQHWRAIASCIAVLMLACHANAQDLSDPEIGELSNDIGYSGPNSDQLIDELRGIVAHCIMAERRTESPLSPENAVLFYRYRAAFVALYNEWQATLELAGATAGVARKQGLEDRAQALFSVLRDIPAPSDFQCPIPDLSEGFHNESLGRELAIALRDDVPDEAKVALNELRDRLSVFLHHGMTDDACHIYNDAAEAAYKAYVIQYDLAEQLVGSALLSEGNGHGSYFLVQGFKSQDVGFDTFDARLLSRGVDGFPSPKDRGYFGSFVDSRPLADEIHCVSNDVAYTGPSPDQRLLELEALITSCAQPDLGGWEPEVAVRRYARFYQDIATALEFNQTRFSETTNEQERAFWAERSDSLRRHLSRFPKPSDFSCPIISVPIKAAPETLERISGAVSFNGLNPTKSGIKGALSFAGLNDGPMQITSSLSFKGLNDGPLEISSFVAFKGLNDGPLEIGSSLFFRGLNEIPARLSGSLRFVGVREEDDTCGGLTTWVQEDEIEYAGRSYFRSSEATNWDGANQGCIDLGGYLASIESSEEACAVLPLIKTCFNEGCWLGAKDYAGSHEYTWLSGDPMSFENWRVGEPNSTGEIYVHAYAEDGTWNDIKADGWPYGNLQYVCEIGDGLPKVPKPVLVDLAGLWKTKSHGMLTIRRDGAEYVGEYEWDDGRIHLEPDGQGNLVGFWSERGSARNCGVEVLGSNHWGSFVVEIGKVKPDGFVAGWGYCDDPPGSSFGFLSKVR